MIKNLILSSLRSLMKTKSTSLLNISALTIGIAACILAYLHIDHELSYDTFHAKSDRIFRVVTGDVKNGEGWVKVSTPIAPKIHAELPEVEAYARLTEFSYNDKVAVAYEDIVFNEKQFYLADPDLFSIFDIETMRGVNGDQLSKNTVAISEVVATKYFGKEDPIGKIIKVDSRMEFEVVSIFRDLPSNSHFEPQFIISFKHLEDAKPGTNLNGNWGQFNYFSYLLLEPTADPTLVDLKIKDIVAEYGDNNSLKFENLGLQPLLDIHFQQNRGNIKAAYDTNYLYIYSAIAFAILLISFINFINLNVANSTRRIKEVGVRKVLGASRSLLTSHFVTESIVMSISATVLALAIVQITLPFINQSMNTSIVFNPTDPWLLLGLTFLVSLMAIFSGTYISLYILSFNPVNAVKGIFKMGNRGKGFKDALLTIQFAVSCILILSSLFIYKQLSYIRNTDLGMNQEGILTLQLFDKAAQEKVDVLLPELKKLSGIKHACGSRFTPGSTNWHQTVTWDDQKEETSWNLISIDKDFIETYGIELLEGDADLIKSQAQNQTRTYIINEAALKVTGWENGLNKVISPFGKDGDAPISGVARDFNYKSLHNQIEPLVLFIANYDRYSQVSISYSTSDITGLLSQVREAFFEVMPETPFEYAFLDDQLEELYLVEKQTSSLVGFLTVIAVVLALMGVYALLSFTIKERTKEIAIRKVLGIEMKGTILLLSKNYLKLLLLGNFIGLPITWYVIGIWLENFSYQTSLGLLSFTLVPVITLILIMLVVGFKTRQVERINPVDALHYE